MKTERERKELAQQVGAAELLRADIPPGPLGDGGLGAHIAELREQLARSGEPSKAGARVEVTFSGPPVLGQVGIRADFTALATSRFQRLVNGFSLAGADSSLFITAPARGSYGFVFEELGQQPLAESPLADAIDAMNSTLRGVGRERSARALDNLEPRQVKPLIAFLKVLSRAKVRVRIASRTQDTVLEAGDADWALETANQIRTTVTTEEVAGSLEGVLPTSRKFEFKPSTGPGFGGVVAPTLDIEKTVQPWVTRACTATFTKTVTEYPSGYTRTTRRLDAVAAEPTAEAGAGPEHEPEA